jgi:hypothetical protein
MGCFQRCLAMAGGPLLERWRSLSFAIKEDSGLDLGPMLTGSLSDLRSVSIRSFSSTLTAALASSAPLLHTIKFTGSGSHNFAPYIGQSFLPRIRKLILKRAWIGNRQFQDLSQLLTSCIALHCLELDDSFPHGPLRDPSSASLWPPDVPSLTRVKCELGLRAWPLLSGMTISTLHISVSFSCDMDVQATSGMKIFLPKLEYLTCESALPTLWASKLFDAPSLISLACISLTKLSFKHLQDTDPNEISAPWPHLRNLSLHWWRPPSDPELKDFLPFLYHHPDIQSLTLRGIPLSSEIFTQPHMPKLCPKLESVAWWLIRDLYAVERAQRRFCDVARKYIGGPQTHWTTECISKHDNFHIPVEEWS